jgi:nucleotide-binding universal stress UspA family protein
VHADVQVTAGKPYREIVRVAKDTDANLIVMGVHGRGVIDRWLFGSTANHVIRQATCPVLTLRG